MMKLRISRMSLNNRGFTLVELMVVVAIIGILGSVAVPSYQRFQSKARQAEAKINLAALYAAEVSFSAENSTYTACLNQIGYAPAAGSKHYYGIGFNASVPTNGCGSNSGFSCRAYANFVTRSGSRKCSLSPGNTHYLATAKVNRYAPTVNESVLRSNIRSTTFSAGATGNISSSKTSLDYWTIDHNKNLVNIEPNL